MSHTHADDKITQEIERISKGLKSADTLKIQSETQLETMRNQYKKVEGEITDMGIDPKKANEALVSMDAEMEALLAEIKALMPEAK